MSSVEPLALPAHLETAPLSLNELSVTLAKSEASTRWIVDAIALNAYKVATLDVKNTQPATATQRAMRKGI
ncbi:unnamed protein product [Penicillium bialowiezense]